MSKKAEKKPATPKPTWVVYSCKGVPLVTHCRREYAIGEFLKSWGYYLTWEQCYRDGWRCVRVAPVKP